MRAAIASIFLCISLASYGSNVDSLLQFFDTRTDTTYSIELCDMGVSVYQEDIGLAISLMQKGLEYSNKINFINGKIKAYTGLSSLHFRNGNLENSLEACTNGIALVEEYNLPAGKKVNFLINRGSAYISAEKYGEAVEAFTLGAKVARDNKLDKKRGMLLNNMGILYRRLKRYDEAINTYNEGLALRISLKDSVGMANTLLNRGATYAKLDSLELTLVDLKKAESLYRELGMTTDVMECQLSTGSAYFDIDEFDKAYEYLSPLYANPVFKPGQEAYLNLRLYMASLYIKRKQFKSASEALNAIKEVKDKDRLEQKTEYYMLRTLLFKETGRAKEALNSMDKYVDLKEEFFNAENAEFRTEMETKYRTAEKDYEIDQLSKEQEITELRLKAASQRNIGLGMGVLMLGGFLWWLSRLNKKIRKQNKVISKANEDKAILLKEIHHRVKNNLQVVSSLLSMG